MSDVPGHYWCYGSDSWKQWELGDIYFGSTALQMSRDGRLVEIQTEAIINRDIECLTLEFPRINSNPVRLFPF